MRKTRGVVNIAVHSCRENTLGMTNTDAFYGQGAFCQSMIEEGRKRPGLQHNLLEIGE